MFTDTIASRVATDYFTLFLKTLYQSLSLLIYAERIQKTISAVNGKYEGINELFGEINLFLTKSMATSVSHTHHQTEFYVYIQKQLRIQEDVRSVTSGLNAIDMLLREQHEAQEKKRDGRLQNIMGLFTLLGISSAFADYFAVIGTQHTFDSGFLVLLGSMKTWEQVCFGVIAIISAVASFIVVKASVWPFIRVIIKRLTNNRSSKGE